MIGGSQVMIKLSQKRKCDRCRALEYDRGMCKCRLGYGINENYNNGVLYPNPKEKCPKPKTVIEYYECIEWYMK